MAEPIINGASTPSRATLLYDAIGRPIAPRDDPAWQQPQDPLAGIQPGDIIRIIHREIPTVVVATGWTVPSARQALQDLVVGLFDAPGQLADDVMGSDSRVQAALGSRLSIFGREVDFRVPRKFRDSSLAKECLDAFVDAWPTMSAESSIAEIERWTITMGFGVAQLLWDTTGDYAVPHPMSWHPRYVYYHWLYNCYVAITQDGQEAIIPGNGSWLIHAPHGEYRGWMRGAIRAITPWWLGRHYALRDWMRYSERHGLPIIKAMTPAIGDPRQQSAFRAQLANLGSETVLHCPQGTEARFSYDVDLMEAKDTAHEGFRMLIEQCDAEITLTLLAQTLTTSMPAEGGSSYAAARVHGDVRQALLEADARALANTVYMQIARPFAAVNFGNADLAPRPVWDVTPYEDALTRAKTFQVVAQGLTGLIGAGWKSKDVGRLFKTFQLGQLDQWDQVEPLQIAAQAARAGSEPASGKAAARARIAQLMAGARINSSAARKMRIAIADEADTDAVREALAMIEADHAPRRRRR